MDYLGFSVLTEPPNRRDVIKTAYRRTATRLDSPAGRFTDDDRTWGPRERMELVWTALDRAATSTLLDFLELTSGRLTPFWVPTWRPDLTLEADYLTPGDSMVVRYVQAARLTGATALDHRRKHLVVIRPAGLVEQGFGWTTITDNEDGTETLTLSGGPGEDVLIAEKHMLSWLQLVRLDTDEPLVHWYTQDLAELSFPVITIPREAPAP